MQHVATWLDIVFTVASHEILRRVAMEGKVRHRYYSSMTQSATQDATQGMTQYTAHDK